MSKLTDYVDGFADKTSTPAEKELVISTKKDETEFVSAGGEC